MRNLAPARIIRALSLGCLIATQLTAAAQTYRVHDLGPIIGNGNSVPFSTFDLGTLGGGSSLLYATNQLGNATGTSVAITGDSHAFLYAGDSGISDLGTLGGFNSTGLGIDSVRNVVGTSQTSRLENHAFLWSKTSGMKDLNELIPVDSGWVLIGADTLDLTGSVAGPGMLHGSLHRFSLTPFVSLDTNPPVAIVVASDITNTLFAAQFFTVEFWDDSRVRAATITTNSIRVTGPNGFDQLATLQRLQPTNDAIQINATFYVAPPGGIWNGSNNGTYTIAVEPVGIRDPNENSMPDGPLGTFHVAAETRPLMSIGFATAPVAGATNSFILSATGSFPHDPSDLFKFSVDWENDGTDVETFRGTNGIVVPHVYFGIGPKEIQSSVTDRHGISSAAETTTLNVIQLPSTQAWSFGPPLPGGRRHAVGLNVQGTLLVAGGLPVKSNAGTVSSLAPGGGGWVEERRLPSATTGFGAGVDIKGRIVFFGGIEPGAGVPNASGFVYSRQSPNALPIASKHFAVQSFSFATDADHRLYSIAGSTSASLTGAGSVGVERYDGAANQWTLLAPLPAARVEAVAAADHAGHILVMGGIDPETGNPARSVFSYDIAGDQWTQRNDLSANVPSLAGWAAVTGGDGQIYLIGGESPGVPGAALSSTFVYDAGLDLWLPGPNLSTARSYFAATLGSDGFIYVMGGNNNSVGGNNGLATVERLETANLRQPLILTGAPESVLAGQPYRYQLIASGNPVPSYALVSGPAGATFDHAHGIFEWTPPLTFRGRQKVVVQAANAQVALDQRFSVEVRSPDVAPPTTPTNLFLFSRTASDVTLSWSAASDKVGVDHYVLWRFFRGSRSSHWGPAVGGITNRSVTYPIVGGALFAVVAVDAAGNQSPLSTPLSAASVPIPSIVHSGTNEPTSVIQGRGFLYTISATAPPAVGFVDFSGPNGMFFSPVTGPETNRIYGVVQWMPTIGQIGTNYFTITATNLNATGSTTFSVIVLPTATDVIPPTPVGVLVFDVVSSTTCSLHWTPAGDNIGIGSYHLQAIHFGGVGQSNQIIGLDVPGSVTNTVFTGLIPAATYTIGITPTDTAGNVGLSVSIFIKTLSAPVGQVQIVPGLGTGTLDLQWSSGGPGWTGTLEYSDSLGSPNWTPVPPLSQWPAALTRITVVLSSETGGRYYRVRPVTPSP